MEEFLTLNEVKKNYVLKVLNHTEGNKAKAAKILGLSIKTIYNLLEKYSREEIVAAKAGLNTTTENTSENLEISAQATEIAEEVSAEIENSSDSGSIF